MSVVARRGFGGLLVHLGYLSTAGIFPVPARLVFGIVPT